MTVGTVTAQEVSAPQKGGTVIVAIGTEPNVLNPVINSSSPTMVPSCMIYEGLVTMSVSAEGNEIKPNLAEAWTISDDGRTYTFKLRDAKWHDGMPFTSEDVRYTLMEVAAKQSPLFSAQVGGNLESVLTPDARTAVVKLKEPSGPLLTALTCELSAGILPAHIFKGSDVAINTATTEAPVGTGPFKLSEWARGSHLKLVAFEDYWDQDRPYLDGIVVRFIPSGGTRTQALLAGEIDYIPMTYFSYSDAEVVRQNPNTKLELSGHAPNMTFAFFNLKNEILNDPKVRHALLTATDREYILKNAFNGFGGAGSAPWTTFIPWATDPSIDYDQSHAFDSKKAAEMLEQAGYKAGADGVRFEVKVAYDPATAERTQAAAALQAMWRQAGVKVELAPLEASVLLPAVHKQSDFDVYISSYNSYFDPAIGVARAYVSGSIGVNFGNAGHYSNPEVDDLFKKASTLTDQEERGVVYRQIQEILMEDLPVITLHSNQGYDAATAKLNGLWGWIGNGRWKDAWMAAE